MRPPRPRFGALRALLETWITQAAADGMTPVAQLLPPSPPRAAAAASGHRAFGASDPPPPTDHLSRSLPASSLLEGLP